MPCHGALGVLEALVIGLLLKMAKHGVSRLFKTFAMAGDERQSL